MFTFTGLLTQESETSSLDRDSFRSECCIDDVLTVRGDIGPTPRHKVHGFINRPLHHIFGKSSRIFFMEIRLTQTDDAERSRVLQVHKPRLLFAPV